tara:strand:- start:8 stop:154 length:147 start_codon:yes stop_codon:yes gene_type:complete
MIAHRTKLIRNAAIMLVYNSVGKLRCSVSVENIGPSLYETGRITRTNI